MVYIDMYHTTMCQPIRAYGTYISLTWSDQWEHELGLDLDQHQTHLVLHFSNIKEEKVTVIKVSKKRCEGHDLELMELSVSLPPSLPIHTVGSSTKKPQHQQAHHQMTTDAQFKIIFKNLCILVPHKDVFDQRSIRKDFFLKIWNLVNLSEVHLVATCGQS